MKNVGPAVNRQPRSPPEGLVEQDFLDKNLQLLSFWGASSFSCYVFALGRDQYFYLTHRQTFHGNWSIL